MAFDKAVDSAQLDAGLTTIADAIRAKGGTDAPLEFPQGMADAVAAIPEGGECDHTVEDGLVTRTLTEYKNDRVTEIGAAAFSQYRTLQKVSLPNVKYLNSKAFEETGLLAADFPALEGYSDLAFRFCEKLQRVVMPNLSRDAIAGFQWAKALQYADFGKKQAKDTGKLYIGRYAFQNCSNLVTLILRVQNAMYSLDGVGGLAGTAIASGTGYIYVPKALVEEYKAATNWITYADQIRAIEDYPDITGG